MTIRAIADGGQVRNQTKAGAMRRTFALLPREKLIKRAVSGEYSALAARITAEELPFPRVVYQASVR